MARDPGPIAHPLECRVYLRRYGRHSRLPRPGSERNHLMPKFLVEATYTAEGHKGLAKDKPSGRKTAITQAVKKLGGKLDAIYFCLGENDVILKAWAATSVNRA